MAQNAHTTLQEQETVHFYEMIAQEKFSKYLNSALLYAANVLFERRPSLVPYRYYKTTILGAIEILIQLFYFKKYGASYSEYYFDIQRIFQDKRFDAKNSKLGLIKTLIIVVIFPILKKMLDDYFVYLKDQLNEGLINDENTSKLKMKLIKVFVKLYPFLNLLNNTVATLYSANYLLNPNAQYYSIGYHILKHKVMRREEENGKENSDVSSQELSKLGFFKDLFSKNFVFFIFLGTKFLDWLFDNNRAQDEAIKDERNQVPAPFEPDTDQSKVNICQICYKSITTPCCLDTCGYVFCQVCIYDYVQTRRKCPITQLECTVDNIHKVYEA